MKYSEYTANQKEALRKFREAKDFLNEAEAYAEQFETKWIGIGNIPNFDHYKRFCLGTNKLTQLEKEKAIMLANLGYLDAKNKFCKDLYFTQSVLYGASIFPQASNINSVRVILTSQYGKSYVTGLISLALAERGEPVNVTCNTSGLTETIMRSIWSALPSARTNIKEKLLSNGLDKFEKIQVSLSRENISFFGGGLIRPISIGGSRKSPLANNNAMGKDGNQVKDESALMDDEAYAETGRSEYGVNKFGFKYLSYEISNPHQQNHFYRDMNEEDVRDNMLIIWADIRITVEEGRINWTEDEFVNSLFFKDLIKVKTYLLCNFDEDGEGRFFSADLQEDNEPINFKENLFFMGLDPADKGIDNINAHLIEYRKDGTVRSFHTENLKPKGKWIDGVTPDIILDNVLNMIIKYKVKVIAVDRGYGQHVTNGLAKRQASLGFILISVVFNERPTKERYEMGISAARRADRKKDELHLDVNDLLEAGMLYATTEVKNILQPQMNSIRKMPLTAAGKVTIESKKLIRQRIGRSPDDLDGLLLAVHALMIYIINNTNIRFYS